MSGKRSLFSLLSLAGLVALVVSVGCQPGLGIGEASSPTATSELTPVTIAMGYIPNVQFAPFYVAKTRGYFREAGLEPTFQYGIEPDLLKLVGTNELQFVVGSGEQVILARSQGLPVVYVMHWYRQFPVCTVALAESGIKKPADLEGRTVGVPGLYGASYVGWKALVYGSGLDESKVNLQSIGYTQAASLVEKKVDAAVCYIMNEPVQLQQAGHTLTIFPVSDYVDVVSNGLITNETTIAEKPELVQALVKALLRGLEDTLQDPAAAFDICLQYVPEAGGENRDTQMAVLRASVDLWRTDRLGYSERASWEASQKFMLEAGLIDRQTDVDSMFTNHFVGEP